MESDIIRPFDSVTLIRPAAVYAARFLIAGLIASSPGFATEQRAPEPEDAALTPTQKVKELLGQPLQPGSRERRLWSAGEPLAGLAMPTPVLIANGLQPGPVLCLTAAVHGDELNGVEMIRQVLYGLDTKTLRGTVIGAPIVNLPGFRRSSRYLPDRRDLNRFFPGNPDGSSAARIAHSFFSEVVSHCDALIDIHTGSFHRSNLPQLRADLTREDVRQLSILFGDIAVLQSVGANGTLRRAASDAGIPTVTIEAGEPLRLQTDAVAAGIAGIRSALIGLNMIPGELGEAGQSVYLRSSWIRADQGGILMSEVSLGSEVANGDILGTVTDPITNRRSVIRAPEKGRLLGMALNQMVMPGFAAYHLGFSEQAAEELAPPEPAVLSKASEAHTPDSSPTAPEAAASVESDPEAYGHED